jgi:hypothetical protein
MIEYRFRVPSVAVFTLYSYSKALEYLFRVPTVGSLSYEHPTVAVTVPPLCVCPIAVRAHEFI